MNLADLYAAPQDDADYQRFSFANADSHEQVLGAIFKQKNGLRLPSYVLDPISLNDFDAWLWRHQDAHTAINEALGLTGNDLTDLDPKDRNQLEYWAILHFNEHNNWAQKLGIS